MEPYGRERLPRLFILGTRHAMEAHNPEAHVTVIGVFRLCPPAPRWTDWRALAEFSCSSPPEIQAQLLVSHTRGCRVHRRASSHILAHRQPIHNMGITSKRGPPTSLHFSIPESTRRCALLSSARPAAQRRECFHPGTGPLGASTTHSFIPTSFTVLYDQTPFHAYNFHRTIAYLAYFPRPEKLHVCTASCQRDSRETIEAPGRVGTQARMHGHPTRRIRLSRGFAGKPFRPPDRSVRSYRCSAPGLGRRWWEWALQYSTVQIPRPVLTRGFSPHGEVNEMRAMERERKRLRPLGMGRRASFGFDVSGIVPNGWQEGFLVLVVELRGQMRLRRGRGPVELRAPSREAYCRQSSYPKPPTIEFLRDRGSRLDAATVTRMC
nr:hypothetical protein CFP56_28734 [Quercus suber]